MITSRLFFSIKFILIFLILYDINFNAFPSFTSARLSFIILLLISLFKNVKITRLQYYYLCLIISVLILAFIQYLFSNEPTQISRLFWFIIYGLITPIILNQYFKDYKEFFLIVVCATSLQSIISIISFINPVFKSLLYSTVIFTTNFDEKQILRAVAFSSVGGASLSLIQSCGVISALFLIKFNIVSNLSKIFIWALIILILISTLIIGRTGLIISGFSILIYFVSEKLNYKKIIFLLFLCIMLFQINLTNILEPVMENVTGFNSEYFSAWIENAFKFNDNSTAEELGSMPIPPLSINTIIGTGKITNQLLKENASGHDSGYIQAYYSLGLILASFFYITYYLFLFFQVKKTRINSLYFLVILIMIIEIKEPFIFQYTFPFFMLTTLLICTRNSTNLINLKIIK